MFQKNLGSWRLFFSFLSVLFAVCPSLFPSKTLVYLPTQEKPALTHTHLKHVTGEQSCSADASVLVVQRPGRVGGRVAAGTESFCDCKCCPDVSVAAVYVWWINSSGLVGRCFGCLTQSFNASTSIRSDKPLAKMRRRVQLLGGIHKHPEKIL